MSERKTKNGFDIGRPKAKIDENLVLQFASLGCTVKEIAAYFNVTDDTIINRFSDVLAKGRSNLKMSLRQMQIKSAKNGNVVMQIWLGKQMLDQSERTVIDLKKIPDEVFIEETQRRLLDESKK
jgi:hypothetical protein